MKHKIRELESTLEVNNSIIADQVNIISKLKNELQGKNQEMILYKERSKKAYEVLKTSHIRARQYNENIQEDRECVKTLLALKTTSNKPIHENENNTATTIVPYQENNLLRVNKQVMVNVQFQGTIHHKLNSEATLVHKKYVIKIANESS